MAGLGWAVTGWARWWWRRLDERPPCLWYAFVAQVAALVLAVVGSFIIVTWGSDDAGRGLWSATGHVANEFWAEGVRQPSLRFSWRWWQWLAELLAPFVIGFCMYQAMLLVLATSGLVWSAGDARVRDLKQAFGVALFRVWWATPLLLAVYLLTLSSVWWIARANTEFEQRFLASYAGSSHWSDLWQAKQEAGLIYRQPEQTLLRSTCVGLGLIAGTAVMLVVLSGPRPGAFSRWPACCEGCGYPLLGIHDKSSCPECGRPLVASRGEARKGAPWALQPSPHTWVVTAFAAVFRPRWLGENLTCSAGTRTHYSFFAIVLALTFLSVLAFALIDDILVGPLVYSRDPEFDEAAVNGLLFIGTLTVCLSGLGTILYPGYFGVLLTHAAKQAKGHNTIFAAAAQAACYLSAFTLASGIMLTAAMATCAALDHLGLLDPLRDLLRSYRIESDDVAVLTLWSVIGGYALTHVVCFCRICWATRYANR